MANAIHGDSLSERIILITGAANGIGASVAKACAAQGATVVLLDKQVPALEQVYDAIEQQGSPTPAIYPLDLKGATQADYQQLAHTVEAHFGGLHGVIHCAATLGQLAPVEHQDGVTWLETLHVNLTAAYLLTQACLPLLKKHHSHLIFTTDHHRDSAYWGAYGISKAGIEALAAQLASELETQGRVQVHCIDPGTVHTDLFTRAFPAADPSQLPKPDDISERYLSLLLDTVIA